MRKFFPLSLIMIAALVLAACSSAATADQTQTDTPAVSEGLPTVNLDTVQAPPPDYTATANAESTANGVDLSMTITPDATGSPDTDVTLSPDQKATIAEAVTPVVPETGGTPGSLETGTPAPGMTATAVLPENAAAFVRLSDLMKLSVNTRDGQNAGTVAGVLIHQPVPAPDVKNPQGLPTATEGGQPGGALVKHTAPYVQFVIVNADAPEDNDATTSTPENASGWQVLVPWQAFTFDQTNGNGENAVVAPQSLTLDASRASLSGAPAYVPNDRSAFAVPDWAQSVNNYWNDQGLDISSAGASGILPGNPIVITDQFNGLNVSDPNNLNIGQTSDLLINIDSGDLTYAVINGADSFNGRVFVIPVTHIDWNSGPYAANGASNEGSLRLNVTADQFNAAPYLDSIDGIELGKEWQQNTDTYWNQNANH